MKKHIFLLALAAALAFAGCNLGGDDDDGDGGGGGGETAKVLRAQWGKTATITEVGTGSIRSSTFQDVAMDSSGNIYAAGYQRSTSTFDYGNGKTAAATSTGYNAVLVKYSPSGTAQWVKTVSGTDTCAFYGVAVDSSGNIYAAGQQNGTASFDYGDGISATGAYTYGNAVLVKYSPEGAAQWAATIQAGSAASSQFSHIAVDSSGVYVIGTQNAAGEVVYGVGLSATGKSATSAVLVKYSSSGAAQWVKMANQTGSAVHQFLGITVDPSNNVYVAGFQNGSFDYGGGLNIEGGHPVLVKYSSDGTALSVETPVSHLGARFTGVAMDSAGNVYVGGYQPAIGTIDFGDGVSAQTIASSTMFLVKYSSSGVAQWAAVPLDGAARTECNAVAVDSAGNVYAAGYQNVGTLDYGNGQTVTGQPDANGNVLVLKYSPAGLAQQAVTVETAPLRSAVTAIRADSSGNVYVSGSQYGAATKTFNYGNGVTLEGSASADNHPNALLLKYREQ
jgi:hypothetical protein